jgi:hypothetical protein
MPQTRKRTTQRMVWGRRKKKVIAQLDAPHLPSRQHCARVYNQLLPWTVTSMHSLGEAPVNHSVMRTTIAGLQAECSRTWHQHCMPDSIEGSGIGWKTCMPACESGSNAGACSARKRRC